MLITLCYMYKLFIAALYYIKKFKHQYLMYSTQVPESSIDFYFLYNYYVTRYKFFISYEL